MNLHYHYATILLLVVIFAKDYKFVKSVDRNHNGTISYSDLTAQAFCLQPHPSQIFDRYFPLHYPEAHLPWVWDAIHDPVLNVVEIVTITRKSCWFNQTIWNRLLTLFPQYASELGGGLLTNVLVPADVESKFDYTDKLHVGQGLLGGRIQCNFYNDEDLVYTTMSDVIRVERSYIDNCPVQIKCPSPMKSEKMWTAVRLERDPQPLIKPGIHLFDKLTEAFPVCELPTYQPQKKMFDVSICAYMFSSETKKLIEWLEYHILLGIDHFFIYNTATTKKQQRVLQNQLHSYIEEGVVTLVSWPYMNCMRNMGTGRYLYFYEPSSKGYLNRDELYTHKRSFKPPKKIMQSSAIASCYARFRWTTTYMAQIDVDEYFAVNPSSKQQQQQQQTAPQSSFKQFVQRVFDKYPKAPAIGFRPIMMDDCPEKPIKSRYSNFLLANTSGVLRVVENAPRTLNEDTSALPRLGRWQYGRLGIVFESKLIVRTEAVDDVYVHYITQLSSPEWSASNLVNIHPKQGVLLHYKSKGGIIGGFHDPHEKRSRAEVVAAGCREVCGSPASMPMTFDLSLQMEMQGRIQMIRQRLYASMKKSSRELERIDFTRHGLSEQRIQQLVQRYVQKVNEVDKRLKTLLKQ